MAKDKSREELSDMTMQALKTYAKSVGLLPGVVNPYKKDGKSELVTKVLRKQTANAKKKSPKKRAPGVACNEIEDCDKLKKYSKDQLKTIVKRCGLKEADIKGKTKKDICELINDSLAPPGTPPASLKKPSAGKTKKTKLPSAQSLKCNEVELCMNKKYARDDLINLGKRCGIKLKDLATSLGKSEGKVTKQDICNAISETLIAKPTTPKSPSTIAKKLAKLDPTVVAAIGPDILQTLFGVKPSTPQLPMVSKKRVGGLPNAKDLDCDTSGELCNKKKYSRSDIIALASKCGINVEDIPKLPGRSQVTKGQICEAISNKIGGGSSAKPVSVSQTPILSRPNLETMSKTQLYEYAKDQLGIKGLSKMAIPKLKDAIRKAWGQSSHPVPSPKPTPPSPISPPHTPVVNPALGGNILNDLFDSPPVSDVVLNPALGGNILNDLFDSPTSPVVSPKVGPKTPPAVPTPISPSVSIPDGTYTRADLMMKKVSELKDILKSQGFDQPYPTGKKQKEMLVDQYILSPKCNPDQGEYCPKGKVCDARSIPGACVDPKYLNVNKSLVTLDPSLCEGAKVMGSKAAIDALAGRLKDNMTQPIPPALVPTSLPLLDRVRLELKKILRSTDDISRFTNKTIRLELGNRLGIAEYTLKANKAAIKKLVDDRIKELGNEEDSDDEPLPQPSPVSQPSPPPQPVLQPSPRPSPQPSLVLQPSPPPQPVLQPSPPPSPFEMDVDLLDLSPQPSPSPSPVLQPDVVYPPPSPLPQPDVVYPQPSPPPSPPPQPDVVYPPQPIPSPPPQPDVVYPPQPDVVYPPQPIPSPPPQPDVVYPPQPIPSPPPQPDVVYPQQPIPSPKTPTGFPPVPSPAIQPQSVAVPKVTMEGELDYSQILQMIQSETKTDINQLRGLERDIFTCMGLLPSSQARMIQEQFVVLEEPDQGPAVENLIDLS